MRRVLMVAAVAGGALALLPGPARAGGACQGGDFTEGSGNTIHMTKSCYTPTVLRTPLGAEVVLVNDDPVAHTVTSAAGAWSKPHKEIGPGDSIAFRFDHSGVYAYTCILHPGMTGAIVVGDGSGPSQGAVEIEVEPAPEPGGVSDAVETPKDTDEDGAGIPIPAVTGALAGVVAGGAGFKLGRRRRV